MIYIFLLSNLCGYFFYLVYNLFMKRFLLITLILILSSNVAFSFSFKRETEKPIVVQTQENQDLSYQASIVYAENDIDKAMEIFLKIPEEQRTPQDWLLIGNILQDKGKLDEAEFMFKKSVNLDKKYFKGYYNLGNIYLQTGKTNMAIAEYKKAINIKPEYPYAHYNLGCAYISQGKYYKAKYELYTATDLKNTVPEFHYNLAFVLNKLNKQKEAKKYLEYYNKLMEQNNYVQGNNF